LIGLRTQVRSTRPPREEFDPFADVQLGLPIAEG
jgi:hypothetical protein